MYRFESRPRQHQKAVLLPAQPFHKPQARQAGHTIVHNLIRCDVRGAGASELVLRHEAHLGSFGHVLPTVHLCDRFMEFTVTPTGLRSTPQAGNHFHIEQRT